MYLRDKIQQLPVSSIPAASPISNRRAHRSRARQPPTSAALSLLPLTVPAPLLSSARLPRHAVTDGQADEALATCRRPRPSTHAASAVARSSSFVTRPSHAATTRRSSPTRRARRTRRTNPPRRLPSYCRRSGLRRFSPRRSPRLIRRTERRPPVRPRRPLRRTGGSVRWW